MFLWFDIYHPEFMYVFFLLNNSSGNKWVDFKIPFEAFAPLDPFQHALWQNIWNPLCSGLGTGSWLTIWPIFLAFLLVSLIFSTRLQTRLKLPYPSVVGFLQCMCTYPIDPICIHFLCCVHGNEHIRIHDVVCNTFVTIAHDARFHLGQE